MFQCYSYSHKGRGSSNCLIKVVIGWSNISKNCLIGFDISETRTERLRNEEIGKEKKELSQMNYNVINRMDESVQVSQEIN